MYQITQKFFDGKLKQNNIFVRNNFISKAFQTNFVLRDITLVLLEILFDMNKS